MTGKEFGDWAIPIAIGRARLRQNWAKLKQSR